MDNIEIDTETNALNVSNSSPCSPYYKPRIDSLNSPDTRVMNPNYEGSTFVSPTLVPMRINGEEDLLISPNRPGYNGVQTLCFEIQENQNINDGNPPEEPEAIINHVQINVQVNNQISHSEQLVQQSNQENNVAAAFDIQQIQDTESKVKTKLKYYIIGFSVNSVINLFAFLAEIGLISYTYLVFLVLLGLGFLVLLNLSKTYFSSLTFKEKIFRHTITASLLSLLIFFIGALLLLRGLEFPLYYATAPGWCITLIYALLFKNCIPLTTQNKRYFVIQIAIWVQLTLVSLRIEREISIPWALTLFIILGLCFIFLTLVLLIFLIFLSALVGGATYFQNSGFRTIVGSFWYFLVSLTTVIWTVLFFLIERKLTSFETGDEATSCDAWFLIGTGYSAFILVLTLLLYNFLLKFISQELLARLRRTQDADHEPKYHVKFETNQTTLKYLTRVSGSYFSSTLRKLSGGEKEKLHQWSKEIMKAKQEKHSPLQFHISHNVFNIPQPCQSKNIGSPNLQTQKTTSFVGSCDLEGHKHFEECKKEDSLGGIDSKNNCLVAYSCDDVDVYPVIERPCEVKEHKENEKEKCLVCFDNEPDAVLMECGHGGVCYGCAIKSWEKNDACHMCRKEVTKILKVHNFYELEISVVTSATTKAKIKK